MSRIYSYHRVSSILQVESGLGLAAQDRACYKEGCLIAEGSDLLWGEAHFGEAKRAGQFIDYGVSAYKIPFEQRKAGKALLAVLKRGDVLIVHRICRLCRSSKDYYRIVTLLSEMGVRLVVVTPKIDLGTAIGRLTIGVCAAMAEFDSAKKGERIKAALKAKKLRGSVLPEERDAVKSVGSDYRPIQRPRMTISDECQPGRIYIYVRCSHRDSASSGLGLLAQMNTAQAYAKELMERCDQLVIGDAFCDAAISASDCTIENRPDGRRMVAELKSGDHVLVYCMDRAFRSTEEMLHTCGEWDKRGITVHFISEGFDMRSPEGRMVATISASLAEMEAAMCSARAKECRAENAALGKFGGGRSTPPFWRQYKIGLEKRLVLDRHQISTFRCIHYLRHCGMTLNEACRRVEEIEAKRENRMVIPITGANRYSGDYSSLPKRYKPTLSGLVYPMWSPSRWKTSLNRWEETLALWRATKQEHREQLKKIALRRIANRETVRRPKKKPLKLEAVCGTTTQSNV